MPLPSRSLETVADRADALRSTLGSLYLDGFFWIPTRSAYGSVGCAGRSRWSSSVLCLTI